MNEQEFSDALRDGVPPRPSSRGWAANARSRARHRRMGVAAAAVVAVVGMATAAMVLWPQIRGNRSSGAVFDAESKEVSDQLGPMTPLKYIGWLVGFVAAIALAKHNRLMVFGKF